MTNDEGQMTKECLNPKPETDRLLEFDISHSGFTRHLAFVIRHWRAACELKTQLFRPSQTRTPRAMQEWLSENGKSSPGRRRAAPA